MPSVSGSTSVRTLNDKLRQVEGAIEISMRGKAKRCAWRWFVFWPAAIC